jgi:hypothetical protein
MNNLHISQSTYVCSCVGVDISLLYEINVDYCYAIGTEYAPNLPNVQHRANLILVIGTDIVSKAFADVLVNSENLISLVRDFCDSPLHP